MRLAIITSIFQLLLVISLVDVTSNSLAAPLRVSRPPPLQLQPRRTPSSPSRRRPSPPVLSPPPPLPPWTGPIPPHYKCNPVRVDATDRGCRNHCMRQDDRTGMLIYYRQQILCCCYNSSRKKWTLLKAA